MSFALQVTPQLVGDYWQTGAQYVIYVANPSATGAVTTNGWNVQLYLKPGVRFASSWNATMLSQTNLQANFQQATWNGIIPAGGSINFGGIVSFPAGMTPPFILSGTGSSSSSTGPPIPTLSAPIVQPISNDAQAASFTVSWDASKTTVTGSPIMYTLHQATDANFTMGVVNYPAVQSLSTQVTVTPAAVSIVYYFRVSAAVGSTVSDLSATVSTTVAASVSPPPPPPLTGTSPLVHSYWETWASDSVSTVAACKFDIVNVAFVRVTGSVSAGYTVDGLDCPISTMQDFIRAVHALGKKVKVCYGGASFAYDVQTTLISKDANVGAATALANFVKQYQLDGVDLDFESSSPAAALQIHFIQTLRGLLPSPTYLLSYTPETPTYATEPWKSTCIGAWQYLDTINPMAYDAYATYDWKVDMTNLIALGLPKSKIAILRMPGPDDQRIMTSLSMLQADAQYVVANNFAGIGTWDLNRDISNATGLGANTVQPLLYSILHP